MVRHYRMDCKLCLCRVLICGSFCREERSAVRGLAEKHRCDGRRSGMCDGNRVDTSGGRLLSKSLPWNSSVCWELLPWPAVRARRSSRSHGSAVLDTVQVCSSCRCTTCIPCWDILGPRAVRQTQPAGRCPTSGLFSPRLGGLNILATCTGLLVLQG